MKPKISLVTLGVANLPLSIEFYKALGFTLETQENTEHIAFFFVEGACARLALFPKAELAKDIGIEPIKGDFTNFTGFTLAHNVASPAAVDATLLEAQKIGARIIKPGQAVFWGGYNGYFADLDGFMWEVAYNPFTDLT